MTATPPGSLDAEAIDPRLRELQLTELRILLDIDTVCDELGIEYFLGEGTLLGAVRHGGFIPWDDDIDLLMRRADYRRFVALAPAKLGPGYRVQHASTTSPYWSPVAKVRLLEGEPHFRQRSIAHLTRDNGPLVDVFPLDAVPRRQGLRLTLRATYIRLLRGLLVHKLGTKPADNLRRRVMRLAARGVSTELLHRQLEWVHTLGDRSTHPYLASLATYHPVANQVYPVEAFTSAVPVSFEGHQLPAPVGYHEVLSTTYGDYLTPPPPAERSVTHDFRLG